MSKNNVVMSSLVYSLHEYGKCLYCSPDGLCGVHYVDNDWLCVNIGPKKTDSGTNNHFKFALPVFVVILWCYQKLIRMTG
jgi:hypothetical protein